MTPRTIRMVARNYDVLTPLLTGDIAPEGIDLEIDRESSIGSFREDETFQAGEMSFSGYVRQLAAGGSDVIGLPVFIMRGFRQRCFFVHRDSGLSSFKDLAGKRIGTNGWPDSGNTWSRSLLRREGVVIEEIDWYVGPIDGVTDQLFGHRFAGKGFPGYVQSAPEGSNLADMVIAGRLDAMMVPWPPRSFYEPNSEVVRLLPDYRRAEEDYARDVGFFPGHHVIGIRRNVLDEDPWIAVSLFDAFEASRRQTEERRLALTDTSPWLLDDLERTGQILGPDWQTNGVAVNMPMISAFCAEMHAQRIIAQPVEPERVFADFLRLTSA